MIASLMALALQAAAAPVLGPIGRQELPARGCAAFLWPAGDGGAAAGPVAMASADAASLRLSLDGARVDLPRVGQHGEGGFGLAASNDYRLAEIAATLEITIAPRADLRDGASIPQATLRLRRNGNDELVMPLVGLIGCHSAG